ncbi:MAG: type II toxin-antitoxin system Phd/YefM family antitoxin [bacterium]
MQFVTIKELSRSPSKFANLANQGVDIIITRNGHPHAILSKIAAGDLEDFILAKHFDLNAAFAEAKQEFQTGKTKNLRTLMDEVQGEPSR